ncbi:MAG: AmmeMemoRadiSam system protein B [Candidatus Omnitrophica bacterium]|nr:AmmeMemoRadiSam system protein B [Candidatus Omnitrophota bacterium]
MAETRTPAVAGQFYPADPKELTQMIEGLLEDVSPPLTPSEAIRAVVVPHAGYVYSGAVAAHSFTPFRGQSIDTVVLIGPSHRIPVNGAAVYPSGAFRTPLGDVPVDAAFSARLTELSGWIRADKIPHGPEHSLEVQLPFLQRALKGDFKIVAVVSNSLPPQGTQDVGRALARAISEYTEAGQKTLLVISTDLTHYPSEADAHEVDGAALKAIETGDPAEVRRCIDQWMSTGTKNLACVMCGDDALLVGMTAAKELGATDIQVLKYATSADSPHGEADRVVGYASIVFQEAGGTEQAGEPALSALIDFLKSHPETERKLLNLARAAVASQAKGARTPPPDPELAQELGPLAQTLVPVFVTLRKQGRLRGCIGTREGHMSLLDGVSHYAVLSSCRDSRFRPVEASELSQLDVELSILSGSVPVESADEIEPGVHGVRVQSKDGRRSGVFLPQVWEETGWDMEEFMSELCSQKAGLPPDAWKRGQVDLFVFEVYKIE